MTGKQNKSMKVCELNQLFMIVQVWMLSLTKIKDK